MSRIKGQEVTLGFTNPDGDQDGITDVQKFEAELDIETLEEHYLGQTAAEYDDIFNGISGSVDLHMRTVDWFKFSEKVQDRAQRRTAAGGKFTATASFAFPNGARVRLTFENIFFGPLPLVADNRKAYVRATIGWKCSTIRRVL